MTITDVRNPATVATHAVFFGAGRYSLVVFPLVAALAALAFVPPRSDLEETAQAL